MSNLYEGEPDARLSSEEIVPYNPFRRRYRALSEEEMTAHDNLKDAYLEVWRQLNLLPGSRYRSLSVTALEESCLWGIKGLTQ